jgi:hypothetical protein
VSRAGVETLSCPRVTETVCEEESELIGVGRGAKQFVNNLLALVAIRAVEKALGLLRRGYAACQVENRCGGETP